MSLTDAQLVTLGNHIRANTDVNGDLGNLGAIRNHYNDNSSFVAWKNLVSLEDIGEAINGENLADLTSANQERVQSWFIVKPSGAMPAQEDHRLFFDDVFSGAAGSETRDALNGDGTGADGLWRQFASLAESLFATGTGSNASPGVLVFAGSLSTSDVDLALEKTA